jgi:choline dehydrogenase-like flavoprotein
VVQDVTVSKVLIKGSTAVGVEYLEGNSTEPKVLLAANEVILSAGVFGSSKILMVRPFLPSPHMFYAAALHQFRMLNWRCKILSEQEFS